MPMTRLHAAASRKSGGRNRGILAHSRAMPVPPDPSPKNTGRAAPAPPTGETAPPASASGADPVAEIGGPGGPDPTRFGDWERAGRCIDF
jgi:hypothetical protein